MLPGRPFEFVFRSEATDLQLCARRNICVRNRMALVMIFNLTILRRKLSWKWGFFFFVTYIIIYSAIERDLYELYPSVLYGFDIIFIPQVWFVKICRFFLFTQNLISLFSPQCLVRYLTFLCVSVSICIFEPVYNLRNTKYIKSL